MTSIWKDLLFMHGYFVRPDDILDVAHSKADRADAQREARQLTELAADTEGLACAGCS
ncbi:MAG: hypothetical protein JNN30_04055 [Rhodanobacteraceae bacterium]|nr:hypothetical protein [Rhodanobacteraceae bacterium]